MDFTGSSFADLYVVHTVSLLEDYPFLSLPRLIDMLCALELEPQEAWDYLTFVPLAYLRALLQPSGARFSDSYVLVDALGNETPLSLDAQPVYHAARAYALEQFSQGMAQESIEAVITRSVEFIELNNRLKRGDDPGSIELGPPHVAQVLPQVGEEDETPQEEDVKNGREEQGPRWWTPWT